MKVSNRIVGCLTACILVLLSSSTAMGHDAIPSDAALLTPDKRFYLACMIAIGFSIGIFLVIGDRARVRYKAVSENPGQAPVLFKTDLTLLRMLTVALVLETVTILAVIGVLNAQSSASLLAAIAGYVLGSMGRPDGEAPATASAPRSPESD